MRIELEGFFRLFKYKIFVLVFYVSLMSVPLYFTFASMFGVVSKEGETTVFFTLFVIAVFLIQLIIYLFTLLRGVILKSELFILLLIFLLIILSFGNGFFEDFELDNFYLFIVMGVTGFFLYFSSVKLYSYKKISIDIYYLSVLFSFCFLFSVFKVLTNSEIFSDINLGGATYQTISYTAVLLFGILLFLMPKFNGFGFSYFILYVSNLIILMLLSLTMFLGGSKGAFLVFVLYLFAYLLFNFKFKTIFIYFLVCVFLLIVGSIFTNDFSLFEIGFSRISMFFDPDVSASDRTTGRDVYYQNFLILFEGAPLFGYGLLSKNGYVSNSHNLFSMFMLQYGILGVIKTVFILILLLITIYKQKSSSGLIFFVLLTHVFVMLFFSGQYFSTLLYWFVLSFMIDNLSREHSK